MTIETKKDCIVADESCGESTIFSACPSSHKSINDDNDNNDINDLEKRAGQDPTDAIEASTTKSNWNKPFGFYMAYLALLLMVFLVSVDATALAVAIPVISRELGGTTLESFWASISFMLAVTVVMPIYTTTSDVLGRKIPLYAAFFLFFVGSIVFAVAPSFGIIIFGRILQGIGGGGLDVLSEVIVADITTLKERALWLGLFSIPMAAGSILGPILGAVFSEYLSWRWIGWINLPIIAVAVALAFFFMKLKPLASTFKEKLQRLDWIGMLLFTVGSILIALPLSWAGGLYPWGSWRTIVPLVIGLLVLVAFGVYEAKPVAPVFLYRIFRSRTAKVTLLGTFIHGLVLYATLFYLPIFFEAVHLKTPLEAAIAYLPFCTVLMAFTAIAAFGVEYLRSYLWEIWLGWVFLAVGVGLFSLWGYDTSVAESAGIQAIAGMGIGTLFTVPSMPMQASAPTTEDQGLAVGILVTFRLFGGLVGLAVGATTFSSVFGKAIAALGPLPASVAMLENSSDAISFIPHLKTADLDPEVLISIIDVYANTLRYIWCVLAALGALGFFASLLTENLAIESEEKGRQHLEQKA